MAGHDGGGYCICWVLRCGAGLIFSHNFPLFDASPSWGETEFHTAREAEELNELHKRLYHRKELKATRGEFVGEPIPPGFILPITGRKANGEYQFGKMEPYPPHAGIDVRIFQEYIRCRGSKLQTALAMEDVAFPPFPPDLSYMERYSALRICPRTPAGTASRRRHQNREAIPVESSR